MLISNESCDGDADDTYSLLLLFFLSRSTSHVNWRKKTNGQRPTITNRLSFFRLNIIILLIKKKNIIILLIQYQIKSTTIPDHTNMIVKFNANMRWNSNFGLALLIIIITSSRPLIISLSVHYFWANSLGIYNCLC